MRDCIEKGTFSVRAYYQSDVWSESNWSFLLKRKNKTVFHISPDSSPEWSILALYSHAHLGKANLPYIKSGKGLLFALSKQPRITVFRALRTRPSYWYEEPGDRAFPSCLLTACLSDTQTPQEGWGRWDLGSGMPKNFQWQWILLKMWNFNYKCNVTLIMIFREKWNEGNYGGKSNTEKWVG